MLYRLDHFLSLQNFGTRKHVKKLIKSKLVRINDEIITNADFKFDPEKNKVYVDDKLINYQKEIYILMNKPKGYMCSTIDELYPSVLNLVDPELQKRCRLVGRLDVDTTGVLLITDNGKLNNRLIHPHLGISKEYLVTFNNDLTEKALTILRGKIDLYDDGIVQAKQVKQVDHNKAIITILEGKYHQIKRMAKRADLEVIELDRIRLDSLTYDGLKQGEYRFLKDEEITYLKKICQMEE